MAPSQRPPPKTTVGLCGKTFGTTGGSENSEPSCATSTESREKNQSQHGIAVGLRPVTQRNTLTPVLNKQAVRAALVKIYKSATISGPFDEMVGKDGVHPGTNNKFYDQMMVYKPTETPKRKYRSTGTGAEGPFDIEVNATDPADTFVEIALNVLGDTPADTLVDTGTGLNVLDCIDPEDPVL